MNVLTGTLLNTPGTLCRFLRSFSANLSVQHSVLWTLHVLISMYPQQYLLTSGNFLSSASVSVSWEVSQAIKNYWNNKSYVSHLLGIPLFDWLMSHISKIAISYCCLFVSDKRINLFTIVLWLKQKNDKITLNKARCENCIVKKEGNSHLHTPFHLSVRFGILATAIH